MKKLLFVAILLFVLTACTSPNPIPYSEITFEKETNTKYVGSYTIGRINKGQRWPEWGEWTSLEQKFKSTVVCFGAFDKTRDAIFRASDGYQWIEIEKGGRNCLELQEIN